jgi:hypothetical protein
MTTVSDIVVTFKTPVVGKGVVDYVISERVIGPFHDDVVGQWVSHVVDRFSTAVSVDVRKVNVVMGVPISTGGKGWGGAIQYARWTAKEHLPVLSPEDVARSCALWLNATGGDTSSSCFICDTGLSEDIHKYVVKLPYLVMNGQPIPVSICQVCNQIGFVVDGEMRTVKVKDGAIAYYQKIDGNLNQS